MICVLKTSIRPSCFIFFFLMIRRPPRSTLFPLHDALPICHPRTGFGQGLRPARILIHKNRANQGDKDEEDSTQTDRRDRKSTRLNSSHGYISYAVFCLKKKKRRRLSRSASW